jgi:acyl carrier protein
MNTGFRDKFQHILKRHFLILPYQIKGRKYLEDLGLTKMEQREMLNYVEDEFKIQFTETDEKHIKTVNDTLYLLQKYVLTNSHI